RSDDNGGSNPSRAASSACAAALSMRSPRAVMTVRSSPEAVSCAPPTPSGPPSVTSERSRVWVQRRLALKPSPPAATATRPRSAKCSRDCSCGRRISQLTPGGGAGGSVRHPASTASSAAPSRSALLRIGNEALDGGLEWFGVRITRKCGRPYAASLGLLAVHPQGFAPVCGDLGIVPERVGVRESERGALGITLTELHPAEAVERGRVVGHHGERATDQCLGVRKLEGMVSERIAECVEQRRVIGPLAQHVLER